MPLFENLKIGGWYTVFEHEDIEPEQPMNPFGMMTQSRPIRYNGAPYKIIAASFPFVLCRDVRGKSVTMDTRVTKLTSCLPSFVKAFYREFGDKSRSKGSGTRRKKKEKLDQYTCPRCGGRIVQVMNRTYDGWRYACRNCDFDGGAVPKT